MLAELARAIADGGRVRAFHAWTLLDNFQWASVSAISFGEIERRVPGANHRPHIGLDCDHGRVKWRTTSATKRDELKNFQLALFEERIQFRQYFITLCINLVHHVEILFFEKEIR